MIKLQSVNKQFKDGDTYTEVLKNINLEIREHDFITLVGVSGSGKTTLLNIIMGLENIDSGSIEKDNIKYGYVTQQAHFLEELNIYDNLVFSIIKNKDFSDIIKYCDYFECSHLLYKKPKNLSGGEKQRINIIRALISKPNLLVLDEPTAALDYENKYKVINALNNIYNTENISILLVTHDRDIISKLSTTELLEIKNKQLLKIV